MRLWKLGVAVPLFSCGQEYDVVAGPVEVDPEDVTDCGFTPVSGTRFHRYDCNPVFTGTDEAWASGVGSTGFHAEEVLGHPFYQMWYATTRADGVGQYGLGYAISADGTNWEPLDVNPVFTNPGDGWNRDSMVAVTVVWDSNDQQYVLAYQGVNYNTDGNGLGILVSDDGQNWAEANNGDFFVNLSAQLNGIVYCWPLALTHEPAIGFRGYIGGSRPQSTVCEIYTYGGPDLDNMSADSQTVILEAGQGQHDAEGVAGAAVVKLEDTYYMFYVGINRWEPIPDTNFIAPYNTTVNVATSPDGLNWTKDPDNPMIGVSVSPDPPFTIGNIAAQAVGPRIHLWIDDSYPDEGGNAVGYFFYEPSVSPHP